MYNLHNRERTNFKISKLKSNGLSIYLYKHYIFNSNFDIKLLMEFLLPHKQNFHDVEFITCVSKTEEVS